MIKGREVEVSDQRAESFRAFYEDSYGAIRAYAARRVGADDADEIAAETFLVAWRKFDAVPSESLPWLYGVARNVISRHYARKGRHERARTALENERIGLSSDESDASDPLLWEAWEQLSVTDREVLALVAWEELSVAEGARAWGCSAPVFSVRLHRARRRLERLLATPGTLRGADPVEA